MPKRYPNIVNSAHWMVVMRGADGKYHPIKGSTLGRMFVFDLKSEAKAAATMLREQTKAAGEDPTNLFGVIKVHMEAIRDV